MFPSLVLTFVFTVVFAVSGAYALVRLALIFSGEPSGGDRLAELSHLLMSLAMIAMAWGLGAGGLATTLQIGVFAGFAVWFIARAVLGGRRHPHDHGRLPNVLHALVSAAMVWMVSAMPLMMGMSTSTGGGGSGHAGHGGGASAAGVPVPGGPDAMGAAPPIGVVVVTAAFAGVLVAGAAIWAVRAARGAIVPAVDPVLVPVGAGVGATVFGGELGPSGDRAGLAALAGPRQDAVCHLLMSLGMAGMLVAML